MSRLADAKRGGGGGWGREKSAKAGKREGSACYIRAGVFVFRPPFSQLIR